MIVSAVPPPSTASASSQQQYGSSTNRNRRTTTTASRMQRQSSTATQITSNTQQQQSSSSFTYGRVSYKGVVALVEDGTDTAGPSGGYVAYGDVLQLYSATTTTGTDSGYYQVHSVLTGGYAVPPHPSIWGWCPAHVVVVVAEGGSDTAAVNVERGCWYYKVISTTPVSIVTGPVHDAPKTKAVALPGSVQAIATRVVDTSTSGGVVWLQLQHRRGWMADRQGTTCVVQETDGLAMTSCTAGSGASRGSADGCTHTSVSTRSTRHRPPRRRRDTAFPRHVKEEPPPIPSSNVSILSDDSFHAPPSSRGGFPSSPESSLANTSTSRTTTATSTAPSPILSLMRVTAPRGLTILDAPHWQVQHHFLRHPNQRRPTSTSCCSQIIYDGKTRRLPCGALFSTAAPAPEPGYDGAQLLQLSDQSGWLVVPTSSSSSSSYVPVGSGDRHGATVWLRVTARSGVPLVCAVENSTSTLSPRSDVGSTASWDHTTTRRRPMDTESSIASRSTTGDASSNAPTPVIACGMCVPVQAPSPGRHGAQQQHYARLRDGQGWIPLTAMSTTTTTAPTTLPLAVPPTVRHGSLWFRVICTSHRLKVRTGPSSRAPSLKSSSGGVRFSCGEHVRASAVVTMHTGTNTTTTTVDAGETWCQLYRHRTASVDPVRWATTPGEWVPVASASAAFLQACPRPPVMERHRQGWRYRVSVTNNNSTPIIIRQGPSLQAAPTGVVVLSGETVVVNERVTSSSTNAVEEETWLRCKDGSGWVQWTADVWERLPVADAS